MAEENAIKAVLTRLEIDNKKLAVNNKKLAAKNEELATKASNLERKLAQLSEQIAWFKRQIFGTKSEKHHIEIDPAVQPSLFEDLASELPAPTEDSQPKQIIASHTRRTKSHDGFMNDTGLRFTDDVPKKRIDIPIPAHLAHGEIIDTKVTHRLAQRRSSYVILEYHYPVVKDSKTNKIHSLNKVNSVFPGSVADVSFMVGLIVNKFAYHLPFYRQHQRLTQAGINLSRATLNNLVGRAAALLAPIHKAQLDNVLTSKVLSVDETPINVGSKERKGKMHKSYFWPLYGDSDEVSFTYSDTRARTHIDRILGDRFNGTLLTDGYAAYTSYVAKQKANNNPITHAACWAHARRKFDEAKMYYPEANKALAILVKLYAVEATIKKKGLTDKDKLDYRIKHSEPLVHAFWCWCDAQLQRPDLEPAGKLASAINYALGERHKLQVYLSDPDVPIDNNHIERSIRPIALGKKNWLFCWTEVGAEHVGIIQSLISTCRLHDIDPYTYLVDVLQRVSEHPASEVDMLTPRLWKRHFADNPLRSDVD